MDSGGAKAAKHDIKATKENKLPAGDNGTSIRRMDKLKRENVLPGRRSFFSAPTAAHSASNLIDVPSIK